MKYTSQELRRLRQEFWLEREHQEAIPASLVASSEDKTAMFTVAGMQPLVPYLSGKKHPQGTRLYNIQRCIRTNDIEEIGDNTHHTMFEMMGNRSLGDYFKDESLTRTIEFLTTVVGIPLERLGATIFGGFDDPNNPIPLDTEAKAILIRLGIAEETITPIPMYANKKCDNFWGPAGTIGPCGPCCEVYYDKGDAFGPKDYDYTDNPRYVEIRNNVFMDRYKNSDGSLSFLEKKNIDTGMGFERLMTILQDKSSAYETDLFFPIIQSLETLCHVPYPHNPTTPEQQRQKQSMRIIAEHIRASAFLIADGVSSSNEGRGYILRRLLRRARFHTLLLTPGQNINPSTLADILIDTLVPLYTEAYPHIQTNHHMIKTACTKERTQFHKTVIKGQTVITNRCTNHPDTAIIPGNYVFTLHDTYGLPPDISDDIARQFGKRIDRERFEQAKDTAREMSKQGAAQKFGKDIDRAQYLDAIPKTTFVGYDTKNTKDYSATCLKKVELEDGRLVYIFDETPLYAESGGQSADHGTIVDDDGTTYIVYDVQKYAGVFLHFVKLSEEDTE